MQISESRKIKFNGVKKTTAVLMPELTIGSGGLRTAVRNISGLCHTQKVHFYIQDLGSGSQVETQRLILQELAGSEFDFELSIGWKSAQADNLIVTSGESAYFSQCCDASTKSYFVQDRESQFNPASSRFVEIEHSYRLGYRTITIGKYLSWSLANEFGIASESIPFGVDTSKYKFSPRPRRQVVRIAVLVQPEKPRRLTELIASALSKVMSLNRNVEIFAFGSHFAPKFSFPHVWLGMLTDEQLSLLYQSCSLGVALSATNPSRVPFEMRACGIPVIDLFGPNTIFDYDDSSVFLVYPSSASLASGILQLLEDDEKMSPSPAKVIDLSEERSAFVNAALRQGNVEKLRLSAIRRISKFDLKPAKVDENAASNLIKSVERQLRLSNVV